jgi:CDP-4-dehydro-6-deoxyglucose reductase
MALTTIAYGDSRLQIDTRPHEPILDGLRRHGYSHRHGCRRGGCGQCKVDVVAGSVEYEASIDETVLTPRERACGTALSCRAIPQADHTVIRLRDEVLKCFLPWQLPAAVPSNETPLPPTI